LLGGIFTDGGYNLELEKQSAAAILISRHRVMASKVKFNLINKLLGSRDIMAQSAG